MQQQIMCSPAAVEGADAVVAAVKDATVHKTHSAMYVYTQQILCSPAAVEGADAVVAAVEDATVHKTHSAM